MTVSRLLMQVASRMYLHYYIMKHPRYQLQNLRLQSPLRCLETQMSEEKEKDEATPLSVSVASQLTTPEDSELSYSTDSDASRILGLEFTSPRSTDTSPGGEYPGESVSWDDLSLPSLSPMPSKSGTPREISHPGESGSWDDISLPSLSPMPSEVGTPPDSMQRSPMCSENDMKEDQAPKGVSSIDIIETPMWRRADAKRQLGQIEEFTPSEPPRKRQRLVSPPLGSDAVCSLFLSPSGFESISQTADDLTESFEADGNLDSPRSRPSSAVLFTSSQVGSGDKEIRPHSAVSRKGELTANEDGSRSLKDRDRASGLPVPVLRRSSRLAGRLCASLEGGAGPRRSPRLALKPRVCYIGMC